MYALKYLWIICSTKLTMCQTKIMQYILNI